MRKIFLSVSLLLMLLTATAFAEEPAEQPSEQASDQSLEQLSEEVFGKQEFDQPDDIYVHTSETFNYTITCPIKPLAVVQNPWPDPAKRGELLVFDNDGFDIRYAYYICVNAWEPDDATIPDFNKGSVAAIGEYLKALKTNGGFAIANLVNISKENKGVFAVMPEQISVTNKETGEVEEYVADKQDLITFFRTPQGRCISVELLCVDLSKPFVDTYRGSVASFVDNSGKKTKREKDKEKKEKERLEKEKREKEKREKKEKKEKEKREKERRAQEEK